MSMAILEKGVRRFCIPSRSTPFSSPHRRPKLLETQRRAAGRSSCAGRVRTVPALSAHHMSASLSTYNPLLLRRENQLFESCLVELVQHLDEAPLVQCLEIFDGLKFERHSISPEDSDAAVMGLDADVFVLCQPVPEREKVGWSSAMAIAGKVGECCEHDEIPHQMINKTNRFWGLVVKSSVCPEVQGCYLMRTTRTNADCGCPCTHYSVKRICSGIPLDDQYDALWLV